MTASLFTAPSTVCARCDGQMVVTKDAIGRERYRCPRCDRVTVRRADPNEALIPQGLVRADKLLPLVRPGQLRCQRCAKGVEGNGRLCPACQAESKKQAGQTRISRGAGVYTPKPCRKCDTVFQPTGPRSSYCEACTTPEQLRHRLSKRKHAKARRGE